MPDSRPRVAIAGGDPARERLTALLADRVMLVPAERAAVVIVDLPAIEALSRALEDLADGRAIVLVERPDAESVAVALRAGAVAVLDRRSDANELLAAIEAALAGLIVLDASARNAFSGGAARASYAPGETLTERERAVLALLARGLSNKRIAAELDISEHTAKFHVGSVLAKLGAVTRAEAVALGARLGYLTV